MGGLIYLSAIGFIELIAAFTLFGYMVAEMRGRKKESRTMTLTWIFFITLGCSVLIEMTKGYPPLLAPNNLGILFMTASGVYGGMIYRLQLTAIQHLFAFAEIPADCWSKTEIPQTGS